MSKKVKIKKDETPVIYKQDIMDHDGKLNALGTILVLGTFLAVLNAAFKYLNNTIIDKDNIN